MQYEAIHYELCKPGIGILSLNRPQKYNAVSQAMMKELEHFWAERENDMETRIVILRGNGEKGFCAGLDMEEGLRIQQNMNALQFYQSQSRMGRLMLKMR